MTPRAMTNKTSGVASRLVALSVLGAVALLSWLAARPGLGPATVEALPLYAARAARTCDNCHADPSKWQNPEAAKRKCNLSCATCHLNPAGGGLRTVVGRYYAQATLPMWLPSHRPHKDLRRSIPYLSFVKDRRHRYWDPALGRPFGGSAAMAYDERRYNGLRADPLLSVGLDARFGFWLPEGTLLAFPMQLDLHAAVHPYRYLTAYVSGGVLAKSRGYGPTFERETPAMVKDTFLMLHQLPYMSYLRVGRFMPTFGTHLADHTVPTRRDLFELDQGQLSSRVTGVEIGAAPNYPFVALSLFRPNQRDTFRGDDPQNDGNPPFLGTSGWGSALSLGWRDLGWSLGASGMLKRRDLEDGGDSEALALHWSFNPWRWLEWLPLTYLGEVAYGSRARELSGNRETYYAAFHQLNALVRNGVNLRVHYDFADPDMDVKGDHFHRLSFGGDIHFIAPLAFRGEVRLWLAGGENQKNATDAFLQIRAMY